MTEDGNVKDALHAALQNNAPELSGSRDGMLTRWYAVTEWIDHEGKSWLCQVADSETPGWVRIGMLEAALTEERRQFEEG